MIKMKKDSVTKAIERHAKWLGGDSPVGITLCRKGLWRTDFRGKDLSYAVFTGSNLKRANFSHANLSFADFRKANLTKVNFEGANLEGALFCGACLKGANFENANFCRTDFRQADLTDTNIKKENVPNCDLTKAVLVGTDLDQKDSRMFFYLMESKGEVTLMVHKEKVHYALLTITRKGTLRREKGLPEHLGFALDSEGRIVLLN